MHNPPVRDLLIPAVPSVHGSLDSTRRQRDHVPIGVPRSVPKRVPREVFDRLVVAATVAVTLLAGTAEAQNNRVEQWTRWGGPHADFTVDTRGLGDTWPEDGPPELWSRPLGAGHSAILVGDGRLYTMFREADGPGGGSPFGPEETVIALDEATGDTLWEFSYTSQVQDFGTGGGPHATPLLVDGRLFTIGTNKQLHVFDAATGDVLWARDLVKDLGAPPLLIRSMIKSGYGSSPLAYNDTIIIQVGGPGQSVMALRQDDGSTVWKSGSFLVSESPPGLVTVDGQLQLIVFAGQAVHGIDPDTGAILWAHPHDAGNDFNFQVPLWGDDNILFVSSGYIAGSRAIRLVRDGGITQVEELWYDPRLRFTFLNQLRIGDFIYGTSGQGATAIMTATHVASGETAWRARGYTRASLLHADGKTIILEEDGTLSLAILDPSGITTQAQTALFDTTSWTAPTLVGTTLYARDRERIVALDLGASSTPVVSASTLTPDFSGMWTHLRSESTTPPSFSGGRGGANIRRLFITHAENGTVVIGPETNGRKAWSFTPGREQSIPVGRDTRMMASSRWDGDRLVAEGVRAPGSSDEMRMHEVMSLSPDGQTLTFVVTTTTPDGDSVGRLLYRKGLPVGPCGEWAMPCKEFPEHVAPR